MKVDEKRTGHWWEPNPHLEHYTCNALTVELWRRLSLYSCASCHLPYPDSVWLCHKSIIQLPAEEQQCTKVKHAVLSMRSPTRRRANVYYHSMTHACHLPRKQTTRSSGVDVHRWIGTTVSNHSPHHSPGRVGGTSHQVNQESAPDMACTLNAILLNFIRSRQCYEDYNEDCRLLWLLAFVTKNLSVTYEWKMQVHVMHFNITLSLKLLCCKT